MKERVLVGMISVVLMTGCSEKTEVALKVLKDKAENRLVHSAGEAEVMLELYRNQYADLKERLIRLKTMQRMFLERSDKAYTTPDNVKRIDMYESQLALLNEKVPQAEATLKACFELYENQKEEVRLLKEELLTYKVSTGLHDDMGVYRGCEKRADLIKELNQKLKEQLARAKTTLEVTQLEKTFIR